MIILENIMGGLENREQYICVDEMELLRGKVGEECRLLIKPKSRVIEVKELYEKSNKISLHVFPLNCGENELIKVRNKKEFEKILEIVAEVEKWTPILQKEVKNEYVWEIVITYREAYEKIMDLLKGGE